MKMFRVDLYYRFYKKSFINPKLKAIIKKLIFKSNKNVNEYKTKQKKIRLSKEETKKFFDIMIILLNRE